MLSGLALIVAGVWLTAQAVAGNLAGRLRVWARALAGRPFDGFGGGEVSGGGGGGSSW